MKKRILHKIYKLVLKRIFMEDYNTEQVKRKYHEEWWNYETDEGLIDAVLYQTNEHVWLISREDYQRGLTMLLNRRIDEG